MERHVPDRKPDGLHAALLRDQTKRTVKKGCNIFERKVSHVHKSFRWSNALRASGETRRKRRRMVPPVQAEDLTPPLRASRRIDQSGRRPGERRWLRAGAAQCQFYDWPDPRPASA
jgi:hypothetical protein